MAAWGAPSTPCARRSSSACRPCGWIRAPPTAGSCSPRQTILEVSNGDFLAAPDPAAEGDLTRTIRDLIEAELGLPEGPDGVASETSEHLGAYLCRSKRRPADNLAFAWKMFRDFMDLDLMRLPKLRVRPFEHQIEAAWPTADDHPAGTAPPPPTSAWINAALRGHYAWSDKLADLYADAHRSSFVLSALLAATAVFTAILPVAGNFDRPASIATAAIEAVILALLVGLPLAARRGRWHQKWMEYRVLAELVRELRILAPLGGARPMPRTSPHLANYGDPTRSWMYWQVRAIAREVGLPDVRVDRAYIDAQAALADLAEFRSGPPGGR